jgi:hypothetical protein
MVSAMASRMSSKYGFRRALPVEHRPVLGVHDLDAQAVRGDLEQDLVLELLQLRVFFDLVLQLLQQQFQTLLLDLLGHGLDGIALDRDFSGGARS